MKIETIRCIIMKIVYLLSFPTKGSITFSEEKSIKNINLHYFIHSDQRLTAMRMIWLADKDIMIFSMIFSKDVLTLNINNDNYTKLKQQNIINPFIEDNLDLADSLVECDGQSPFILLLWESISTSQ